MIRIDKWLSMVRLLKKRSMATDACKKNKILVNGILAKPSREVKIGDVIIFRRPPWQHTFKVISVTLSKGAPNDLASYAEDLTPADQLEGMRLDAIEKQRYRQQQR